MQLTIANSLDEALAALSSGARPIAGGSDLVVGARHGKSPLPDSLVAIDRLAEISQITDAPDGGLSIGAGVNHATIITDKRILATYPGLADASALVGSPATRNVGTLGGNVMNASPAMDTGAPLLTMGATVELRSLGGTRTVAIADLWSGPGQTTAASDELCTSIVLPAPGARTSSGYIRLEYRRAMEIAVVGAGATVGLADDGSIASASLALTAVGPTILGVDVSSLIGMGADDASAAASSLASAAATPISDVRASDSYRRHTVGVMASRAIAAAAARAAGESIAVPLNRSTGIGAS